MATKKKNPEPEIKEVKCKEPDLEALFVKHASTPQVGKKIYKTLSAHGGREFLMGLSLDDLTKLVGRKGAILAVEVACDLAGKK